MFVSLSPDQATAIRQKLLEALANESDRTVRNKISDAVADVGRQYSENSQSSPILPEQQAHQSCMTQWRRQWLTLL